MLTDSELQQQLPSFHTTQSGLLCEIFLFLHDKMVILYRSNNT